MVSKVEGLKKAVNLGELIQQNRGSNSGITFLQNNEDVFMSYKELHTMALKTLYGLQEKELKVGDELIFQLEDNREFIITFWACMLGGIIPVPVTIGNTDEQKHKLLKIWKILNNPYLITDKESLTKLEEYIQANDNGTLIEDISSKTILTNIIYNSQQNGTIHKANPNDIAFLQFSSGSTGDPKGVILTHENLLYNINDISNSLKLDEKDSMLSWMPLTHDMGLIALHLTPLFRGINQYFMPTSSFIMNPIRWMNKTHEYKVTVLGSPNFGYKHFLTFLRDKTDKEWDLSHVRAIINGAEPICEKLNNEFYTKMSKWGLKMKADLPAYGLAEASVAVAFSRLDEELISYTLHRDHLSVGAKVVEVSKEQDYGVNFVDLGYVIEHCSIRICDDDDKILPEDTVGHIQIKGKNVTKGYLNNPNATANVMTADGWLKTGDLGFLRNERIIVTGRAKDIIFINGQNYYPHDIERIAAEIKEAELGKAVACGVFNQSKQKEDIVLFVLYKRKLESFAKLAIEFKRLINKSTGLDIEHVIPVRKIPKTTSGKVQRFKLREEFQQGVYTEVINELDQLMKQEMSSRKVDIATNRLEEVLVKIWADILGIEKIGINDNFFELGGNSLKATYIALKIYKELEVEISFKYLFESPTIKALAEHISSLEKTEYKLIEKIEEAEYYPLSSPQKRMYVLNKVDNTGVNYNISQEVIIEGDLNREKFENACREIIIRHESLRTTFEMVDGEPVQRIHKEIDLPLTYIEAEARDIEAVIKDFAQPFDLSKAPLIRMGLIKENDTKHYFIIDVHHIVFDGTSMFILFKELMELYNGNQVENLRIQYKDFSAWQNQLFQSSKIEEQKEYWLQQFSDEVPVLNLIGDYPRPPIQNFEGDTTTYQLEEELTHKLKQVCKKTGTTLYMLLLAAYNILLSKYSSQEDIVVGSPIAGRSHTELEGMIGMFVNTLPMRNFPKGEKNFKEFLVEVKENSLKAFENQDYQFEELVDQLNITRDVSRNPLFDVMFTMQNMDIQQLNLKGLTIKSYEIKNKISRFDMIVFAMEQEKRIKLDIEYCTKIFKKETIEMFYQHFINVLTCIGENLETKLSDIEIVTEEEKNKILYKFNNTKAEYPRDKTIHQLFEEQVKKHPDNIAAIFGNESLTYKELDGKANKLANFMTTEEDVKPDCLVGIIMDRSQFMLEAILGIVKAGGAYVPIDPAYPEDRIKAIIEDAEIKLVLTTTNHLKLVNKLQWECSTFNSYVCLDSDDIYRPEATEDHGLMDENLWGYVGSSGTDEISEGGWVSSYTGEEFTKEEMKEYADNIFEKLLPYLHSGAKVLEIGCASGISMYKIAPKVAEYYGTDLSSVMIEKNRQRVVKEGFTNIKLECLSAHEIEKLKGNEFDIIIMNSVIQYFPGYNYLRDVIAKAIDILGDTGILYIGDIMDHDLKPSLVQSLMEFKVSNPQYGNKIKTDFSDELFVTRRFLEDIKVDYKEIQDISSLNKIHTIENELTRFRYDSIVKIDKTENIISENSTNNQGKKKYQKGVNALIKYPDTLEGCYSGPNHLAYVIYTSGSTGKPKGVMIEHYSLINRLNWMQKQYPIDKGDVILQKTPYTFDVSLWELFWWGIAGGKVCLLEKGGEKDPKSIIKAIEKYQITTMHFVPSMLQAFLEYLEDNIERSNLSSLKQVFTSGEALTLHQVNKFHYLISKRFNTKLINLYGPTEATVDVSYFDCEEGIELITVPIGKPIDNTQLYVIDEKRRLQPIGIPGELCIAGDGLARGYLNRAELTAEKFVDNPFQVDGKMYRTGDLARWLADGNIEFLGRIDHQVKIRGFRIELGEIENILLSFNDVKEAVVVAKEDQEGNKYLCGYFTAEQEVSVAEIKEHLAKALPEYMIPSYMIQLKNMPLSSNGKLDRKALPEPNERSMVTVDYVVAEREIEKSLLEIWQEILGIERIGINHNFFELGGHSLKATGLVAKIHKKLNVEVPLNEIFKNPTIKGIADYIEGEDESIFSSIEVVEEREYYPVSSAQRRIYTLQQFDKEVVSYNMAGVVVMEGNIDVKRMGEAFRQLINRHESLRTSFKMLEGELIQIINKDISFQLDYMEEKEEDFDGILNNFVKPFNLEKAPLFRAGLVKVANEKYLLMIDMHHIISDGVSISIFFKELAKLYSGEELEELRIQYKEYTLWQNKLLGAEKIQNQKEYWLQQFKEEIPVLNLRGDYPRPSIQSFEGDYIGYQLEETLTTKLKEICQQTGSTLYMLLLASYNVLLSKYTAQEDIVVGSPVAGRSHGDLDKMIGMFVNALAMRNYPKGEKTFKDFLHEVKGNALKAFENQDYQFEELVECLNITRDISRNPLFDVMFTMQNKEMVTVEVEGLKVELYRAKTNISKFDLTLSASEMGNSLYLELEYSSKIFKKETVERFFKHYENILKQIVAGLDVKLCNIQLLLEEEKHQILTEFNNTDVVVSMDKTIHQLFEEQVDRTPDNTAVVYEDKKLTYKQLNEKSNQLAGLLREKGVTSDGIVGIMVQPSLEMLVGIMAILKAGGAYLPIDPQYPQDRINYMLEDSNANILLTQKGLKDNLNFKGEITILDCEGLFKGDKVNLEHINSVNDLAYIIYTSGSTGKPKGVMVEHASLVNLSKWHINNINITEKQRATKYAGFGFDASVLEIFPIIISGATIYMVKPEIRPDIYKLNRYLEDNKIDISFLPTQIAEKFMELENKHLKTLLTGGDKLKQFIPKNYKVIDNYGPTENTVVTTIFTVDKQYNNIPIGKPIANNKIYIVDKNNNLQPIGVAGELCIGGKGLARGYLNNPQLTAEKYVDNPFVLGEKMYKTGDLACWLPDGNIEFLGRIDHQVKIRGYRIELGEIENVFLSHKNIKEAIVITRDDADGGKYLCGYFVGEVKLDESEIKRDLAQKLPEYMVPSFIMQLDKFSINANGKIDKKALPQPNGSGSLGTVYAAPRNVAEELLAEIWQDVLGIEKVGIDDNFFELGGHSLNASSMVSKIHKKLNIELPLKEVFKNPTIRGIEKYIKNAKISAYSTIEAVEEKAYYPASSAQKRIYTLQQLDRDSVSYNMAGAILMEGTVDRHRLEESFKKLIHRHEALRTTFKMVEGEVVQFIDKEIDLQMEYVEETEAVNDILKDFIQPFNLEKAPLLRVKLLKLHQRKHLLMLDIHHIVADGVSVNIFFKELTELYKGSQLDELKIQYKDFSEWQNRLMESDGLKEQKAYWLQQFNDEVPVLNLVGDYPRPALQSFEGDIVSFNLGEEITLKLREICQKTGATMYMALLSVYNILLSKYSSQEDIVVGSPIAGRPHGDLENIIGMFVNTLAMRNYPKAEKIFSSFLEEVKVNALRAYENQDYQFEELVENLNITRDISRNPLFDVMFVMKNFQVENFKMEGLDITLHNLESNISKFDMTMVATESHNNIEIQLEYCTKLFRKETIERLIGHYENLLKQVTDNVNARLSDLELPTETEKNQLLVEFNNTKTKYPMYMTLHQLFEEQVEKTPNNIALVYEDSNLTYNELNHKANQLAWLLREKGVKTDTVVGIMVERSLEMVVGMIAILKSGGTYLPIDPQYPKDRIKYILEDSQTSILLTQSNLKDTINFSGNVITFEDEEIQLQATENLLNENIATDMAYIIYTSGSTGKPKGVMVEHKNVVRLLINDDNLFDFTNEDVWTMFHSFCFDFSVWEMYGALLYGGKLVVVPKLTAQNPAEYLKLLKKEKVTVLNQTPTAFYNLINEEMNCAGNGAESIRYIIFGGEALKPSALKYWWQKYSQTKFINMYGITETTVHVTYKEITELEIKTNVSNIGKPIPTLKTYVMDKHMKLMPIGVPGELCVAGDGVARGYFNRKGLTEERFVLNPYIKERMYKSGDLVRMLPTGDMEYLGRIDHQVKIRGYRIELGEIENKLLSHAEINEAMVMERIDGDGNNYLCGYIIGEKQLSVSVVREHLSKELPDYMIPSYIIQLEKMPLTSNGKIDRKALPVPDGKIVTGVEYEEPRNEVERILIEIWQEILGVEGIGIKDNFFALGGDSIKAIQVSARLQRHHLKLETKHLLLNPVIKELSIYVVEGSREINQEKVLGVVELTPIQNWFFEGNFTDMHHWNQSVMLYKKEGFSEEILNKAFNKLIEHHDLLRAVGHRENNEVKLVIRDIEENLFTLKTYDFTGEENWEEKIKINANKLQGSIDLTSGPLVKLGLFKTPEGDHLLIVIHHLVVDGVSWRILLEDLNTAYQQVMEEKEIKLQEKSNSFKAWASELREYANSKQLLRELSYWKEVEGFEIPLLPVDNPVETNRRIDGNNLEVILSKEDTEKLLRQVNGAYNTEINDILLTALGLAVKEWGGNEKVLINLEGHGREVINQLDITRTVGWFTSAYPVVLDVSWSTDLALQIKMIKEKLRKIPNKGMGYGVLKYLTSPENKQDIHFIKSAEINFNYLGQFDQDVSTAIFGVSHLPKGDELSPNTERNFKLDINGLISNGQLKMIFNYNQFEYNESTIKQLTEGFFTCLKEIIIHCTTKEEVELTPSDTNTSDIDLDEFEDILMELEENLS